MLNKKTILFAVIFLILILTPAGLNQYYNHLLSPLNSKTQEEKLFIITPGQPLASIAQNLEKQKIIKSAFAFRLLIAQSLEEGLKEPGIQVCLPTKQQL